MADGLRDIRNVFQGLQTLYETYLPKVDPVLIHDLLVREKEKSEKSPFYMVEIFTKPGTDSEKMKVEHRPLYDRFLTLHRSATRNRLAAGAAFVSGILFIISGYQANFELYYLVREQIPILIQTQEVELWMFVLDRIGIFSIISQLGGIAVLIGAGLFVANRVNLGKLLVIIGTGQGLLTIGLHILLEIQSGRILSSENNYIIWLTSSATGLGILFAIVSQSLSKGKSESVTSRVLRFVLRRRRKRITKTNKK